jgi:hypothetical protein
VPFWTLFFFSLLSKTNKKLVGISYAYPGMTHIGMIAANETKKWTFKT